MPVMMPHFLIAIAVVASWPSLAAADPASNTLNSAMLAPDGTSLSLAFADGRSLTIAADDAETTFGQPRIADDYQRAGWPVMRADGASYSTPVGIAVYANGVRHDVGCDGGMPWTWRFASRDRVVLKCAFPHGPAAASLQLVDVQTGKVRERVTLVGDSEALPAKAPAWARIPLPD